MGNMHTGPPHGVHIGYMCNANVYDMWCIPYYFYKWYGFLKTELIDILLVYFCHCRCSKPCTTWM